MAYNSGISPMYNILPFGIIPAILRIYNPLDETPIPLDFPSFHPFAPTPRLITTEREYHSPSDSV